MDHPELRLFLKQFEMKRLLEPGLEREWSPVQAATAPIQLPSSSQEDLMNELNDGIPGGPVTYTDPGGTSATAQRQGPGWKLQPG